MECVLHLPKNNKIEMRYLLGVECYANVYPCVQGVIEQDQVDSFNVPNVYPCVKDLRRVVERNGCFEIVKMEFGEVSIGKVEPENSIMIIRAIFEGCMANHFGAMVVNQLFVRAMQNKLQFAEILNSAGIQGTISQIMVVLKRI